MNPLLLIGGAVLVTGLLVLVATMLLRPASSRAHLSVAELQARLAKEQEAVTPEPQSSEEDEPASDDSRTDGETRLVMPPVRRQLPYPLTDGTTSESTSTTAEESSDDAQAERRAAAAALLRRIASA
ncbi:hypothetical protein OHA40_21485 [Nocardia sp. NBC_00508]|uniref:hypothetical protein n=1 Tax=Nocardia sp. NBC_00508 TaxID=2975992 RepID=UPI002E817BB7|nr:hypothetical protein [Nocardia sp. NBC_00508]WUD64273.1 hypothetical protein OHA40_21485 [Nocardia sp. NBC_00508]